MTPLDLKPFNQLGPEALLRWIVVLGGGEPRGHREGGLP